MYFIHLHHSPLFAQIKRGISTWLHKFAIAAEKALTAEFELQRLATTEERAQFVHFLLGDVDDILSKRRPFLWKSAYVPGDEDTPLQVRNVCYTYTPTRSLMRRVGVIPRAFGHTNVF